MVVCSIPLVCLLLAIDPVIASCYDITNKWPNCELLWVQSMDNVVPGALRHLREADIMSMAGLELAALGQEYYRIGAVHSTMRQER